MSKTILLIENDAPFAEETSGALEAMGYQVHVTGDGKEGLDLAKDLKPDAIVLCVELPKLSGYSICNKLKKDEALKAIPLILTSSEATEEVFEDHKKLKVRAEDYLIKPYVSAALLEKLMGLIGMPEGGAADLPHAAAMLAGAVGGEEEEVVSLEEELGLQPFAGEPGQELPALDLDSLPDEPAAAGAGVSELDEDLKLLDDAFDGLSAPAAPPPSTRASAPRETTPEADAKATGEAIEKALGVDRPVTSEDLEAASASLPEEDEASARADLDDLGDEADLALGSLGDSQASPAPSEFDALDALDALDEPASAATLKAAPLAPAVAAGVAANGAGVAAAVASGGSSIELARLETELADRRAALKSREGDLRELRGKLDAAVRHATELESALGEKEAETASLKARGDTLAAQSKKAEADARRATEQAREAEARAAAATAKAASAEGRCRSAEQEAATQRRAAEQSAAALAARSAELAAAQASATQLSDLEREVERLETELVVTRGELDGTRSEVEQRVVDLKRRISELETANSKNEERVVKAYLKIKGDEKVRDKARKALAIALQLLDEGLPSESSGEKRPRPVPE